MSKISYLIELSLRKYVDSGLSYIALGIFVNAANKINCNVKVKTLLSFKLKIMFFPHMFI